MNEDNTGISTLSPFGLAIKPRIPATCVKLEILPRALECIIMKIGLSKSALAFSWSSAWTLSLAAFHVSTTFSYLSWSVIKPRLYCLLILSTTFWASRTISGFLSLLTTSAIDTVIPAIVEYLNPKSFNLSSMIEVSVVL